MLTERREQILRFVVDEYVRTAQPVASASIVRHHDLPVSSATVRNEMAKLEEDGYIVQPHTSAGRIPSDVGYRYYVETLMQPRDLPHSVQETIRHQFHQAHSEVAEWARLAAAVLAARLSYAAAVTSPHADRPRLQWVQIVSVHDYLAMLVVVLQEARVLQHALTLDRPTYQDELSRSSARLNALYAGHTAEEIRSEQVEHLSLESAALDAMLSLMDASEGDSLGEVYLEGLSDMLREPEFAEGKRILNLLDLLGQPTLADAIPVASFADRKVSVVIGSEHPHEAMQECSVVVSPYEGPSGMRGAISVFGPTRMHYRKTVSMVRYMSSIMEELLDAYFE